MLKLTLNKFLGLFTRSGRSGRPLGALDDILNYVLNSKFGKAILRSGYTADISGAITSVDSVTMTTIQNNFKTAAEIPEVKYFDVLLGTDAGANKWFFQKPYYHQSATATDSWLKWGESLSTTITTYAAVDETSVKLNSGNATNDYYNGWLLYNTDKSMAAYIVDYVGSTQIATVIAVYSQGVAPTWATNDNCVAYRHFHDNRTFSPSFTTQPCVLQQGNGILASGGQSSTVGCKPIWSGYINKTFALDAAITNTVYQGTYVTEAEVKSTNGFSLQNASSWASVGNGLTTGKYWFLGWILETDDGQRSALLKASTHYLSPAADQGIQEELRIRFGELNKRIKKIHSFIGQGTDTTNTTLEWNSYYFIATTDLTSGNGWTYNLGATTGDRYFSRTFQYDIRDWNKRGMSLAEFVGSDVYTSSTVSFSFGTFIANRLVVAKYYDYSNSTNYDDQIRYSGFGDGVPQYNVLPDISDFTESTIGAGDPAVVTGLSKNENFLFIAKTNSVYSIEMTDDPTEWVLTTIAPNIGCDAPYTLITTPMGVFWAKGGDDIYFWRGGFPIGLAKNWLVDFRALSTSSLTSWYAWYDKSLKSIGIKCNTGDETVWYQMHLDYPIEDVFAWVRHKQQHSIKHVTVRTDGVPFFTNATATYYYDRTATDDAGTAITPFIDTGDYVPDEDLLARIRRWYLNCEQSGSTANQLDAQLLIDGSAVGSYTALTKTNTRFNLPAPIAAMGSRMRLKFNTNATKASLGTSHTIHEIGIEYEAVPYSGDASIKS